MYCKLDTLYLLHHNVKFYFKVKISALFPQYTMPIKLKLALEEEANGNKTASALFRLIIGKKIPNQEFRIANNAEAVLEEQETLVDSCYSIIF